MTSKHSSSHSNGIKATAVVKDYSHSLSVGNIVTNTDVEQIVHDGPSAMKLLYNTAKQVRSRMYSPTGTLSDSLEYAEYNKSNFDAIVGSIQGTVYPTRYANGTYTMNFSSKSSAHQNTGARTNNSVTAPTNFSNAHANSDGASNTWGLSNIGLSNITTAKVSALTASNVTATFNQSDIVASAKAAISAMNQYNVNGTNVPKFNGKSNVAVGISGHNNHSSYGDCKRELKCDIKDADMDATDIISKTDIVSFRYKDDPSHLTHYGFIADDTDEAFTTEAKDRMDYTNCIGILMKSIQELNDRIKELEKMNGYNKETDI